MRLGRLVQTGPLAAALALATACSRTPSPTVSPAAAGVAAAPSPHLPPVPFVTGPLALKVVYPSPGDVVDARDSSFIFGSAGSGDATVTINGAPVRVWPNGAWIGWIAFPPDSLMQFDIVARTPRDSAHLVWTARRTRRREAPTGALWIDSTSITPRGDLWLPADEYVTVSVRAAEGSSLVLRLPGGGAVPFTSVAALDEVPDAIRAFDRDTANLRRTTRSDRYVAVLRGRRIGADPGPLVGAASAAASATLPSADTAQAVIEAVRGTDTVRARWPIRLALLDTVPLRVRLDDDTAGRGNTDSITIGRALVGGTYNWFFPTGTETVASGRANNDLRLRLAPGLDVWVPAADAHVLPAATQRAVVGSVTLTPRPDRVTVRIPVSARVPFQVTETERTLSLTLYNAVGDVNWIRYGSPDSLIRSVAWSQGSDRNVTLTVELGRALWGFHTRWDRGDLLLDIRRPPVIDAGDPLEGRLIVVDPGHPPIGATGPTGFREAQANLGVALILRDLLQSAGARVVMTRVSDSAVDLFPRTKLADTVNAELLISIHNNALPDGVNPFTNNGTSVFYNHPRSIPLAMAVDRALVARLGLRDLGVGRGDLALVRPTWMPAILAEGLFMMLPDQEAALRSPEGQRLYAQGVFDGIRQFLRDRARAP
ncbi:MAG TPA: N-acetylmuramoyl-L-alanine amidase [Verrucomicrobiae bacterium]|nr:N-acetylmuramoyl-L-alanine amidase [Verrucomicrobiae bacterium]